MQKFEPTLMHVMKNVHNMKVKYCMVTYNKSV